MHPEDGLAKSGGCTALCRGVTSHAVHISGTAAETGFFCNTSKMGTDMSCCPAPPCPPLLTLSSCPSLIHHPHIESQTKRNALLVFLR